MTAAIIDHLWQSTLVMGLVGVLVAVLRRGPARIRFRLWLIASLKFLIPFAIFGAVFRRFSENAASTAAMPVGWQIAQASAVQATQPFAALSHNVLPPAGFNWILLLGIVWTLGTLRVLLGWAVRWSRLASALKSATAASIPAPLPVMMSQTVLEPGLVGIWRPVLLLPEGITEQLSGPEMDAMLAHELCHWRRHDNLTAALHMLVQALFWFHPLVWWLGARLVVDREQACDEYVVDSGRDPESYVQSLFKVCKLYTQSPLVCAAGVAGGDLRLRMEGIMAQERPRALDLPEKSLLAFAACLVLMVAIFVGLARAPGASPAYDNAVPSPGEILQARAEQAAVRHAVPMDPVQFDRFAGFYQYLTYAAIHLARIGDHFYSLSPNGDRIEIYPESGTKFFSKTMPAQFSFVTDSTGAVTGMILHQDGLEIQCQKIDAAAAAALTTARIRHVRDNRPAPGSEAFVRKELASLQAGQSDDADMTPAFAGLWRLQLSNNVQARLKPLGTLQSLRFLNVSPNGRDTFEVTFAHGKLVAGIMPPMRGKIIGFGFENPQNEQ